jgi:O-antigen/teichoic acid export membrane protein
VIAAPGRALQQAALPLIADAWKRRDHDSIGNLYRRSSLVQTLISGLLFLLMWASLDDVFSILPLEYAAAGKVAWVIGLAYWLNSTVGMSIGIISMSRSYRMDAYSNLSMLVLNGLANFFLIRSMGIIGAAWATLLSLVLVNSLRTYYLWSKYRLWPYNLNILKIVLLVVVLGWSIAWVPFTGDPIPDIFLRSIVVLILFALLVNVLGIGNDLTSLIRMIKVPSKYQR